MKRNTILLLFILIIISLNGFSQVFPYDTNPWVAISNKLILDDEPIGTKVGSFQVLYVFNSSSTEYTYSLVSGEGDTDNGSFKISGADLYTNATFNASLQSTCKIRVQAQGKDGVIITTIKTIYVRKYSVCLYVENISIETTSSIIDQGDSTNLFVNENSLSNLRYQYTEGIHTAEAWSPPPPNWSTGEKSFRITVNPKSTTTYWVDLGSCRKYITIEVKNASIPESIPQSGLVAWYPFNDNANDESGNGNNGIVNGASLTDDRFGNINTAYSFRGYGYKDHIKIKNSSSLNNLSEYSLMIYFKVKKGSLMNGGGSQGGDSNQTGALLTREGDGIGTPPGFFNDVRINRDTLSVGYYYTNGCCDARNYQNNIKKYTSQIEFEKWYQLIVVAKPGSYSIYINGQKKIESELAGDFSILNNLNMYVGIYGFGGDKEPTWYPFLGSIDDIGIWNRALTAQEIQNLNQGENIISQCGIKGSITDSLVAFYPFCGNANNAMGNVLNGTVNGATLTIDRFGNLNSAYSFTTNQDIIIQNTQSLNLYPITISLWYNIDSLNTEDNGNIFSKYVPAAWNGFQILYSDFRNVWNEGKLIDNGFGVSPWYLRNGNNRLIGYYNEPPFLQQNISSNTWYHYVFVVDSTGGKIYVNGQLIDSHNWTGNPGPSTSSFLWKIGGLYTKWFHGKIDDVGIWKRALTEQEIQQLYNGLPCNTPAPTGNTAQGFVEGTTVASLIATGTNIKWYSTLTGGTPLSINTVLVNGLTYYASQIIEGCESQNRLAVKVTLTPKIGRFIYFEDQTAKVGSTIDIIIKTSELKLTDGIISYQFNFNYDSQKLQYLNKSVDGTIAQGGNILVNSTTNGVLRISYMNQNTLVGSGAILKLTFKILGNGTITPTISDFLYNSDKITTITNGIIKAILRYGDIDDNGYVQAFDAALAIQYSVGFDPLPTIDPLPWESWRFIVGNVDGKGEITAYDAALILQYSVGLIKIFPVEGSKQSTINNADVKISIINNELYFSASGSVIGFNLSCNGCSDKLGQPVILYKDFLSAINITGDSYYVGLAATTPPNENQPFMKIPILKNDSITFKLITNNITSYIGVRLITTDINERANNRVLIYPNPAKTYLNISFGDYAIQKGYTVEIINMIGQEVFHAIVNQQIYNINVSNWTGKGIYLVHLTNEFGETVEVKKIVVY